MKKLIGLLAAIALIIALAFWYFSLGKKAAIETRDYMQDAKGTIDAARQSVDESNKAAEEATKAIEKMTR